MSSEALLASLEDIDWFEGMPPALAEASRRRIAEPAAPGGQWRRLIAVVLDVECIYGPGDYGKLFDELTDATQGVLPRDAFSESWEEREDAPRVKLAVKLGGKSRRRSFDQHGDYFDEKCLDLVNAALELADSPLRFQPVYGDESQLLALALVTPAAFEAALDASLLPSEPSDAPEDEEGPDPRDRAPLSARLLAWGRGASAGRLFAVGVDDVLVWLDTGGEQRGELDGGYDVDALWIGAGGRELIVLDGRADAPARVLRHDALSLAVLGSWEIPAASVRFSGFAADADRLAATCPRRDGSGEDLIVFDVISGAEVARIEMTADVWAVAITPDGQKVATSQRDDSSLVIYDVASGEVQARTVEGDTDFCDPIAFDATGSQLLCASEDGVLSVRSAGDLALVCATPPPEEEPEPSITAGVLAASPRPSAPFAHGGTEGVIAFVDPATAAVQRSERLQQSGFGFEGCAFSPDGAHLAVHPEVELHIAILDATNGRRIATVGERWEGERLPQSPPEVPPAPESAPAAPTPEPPPKAPAPEPSAPDAVEEAPADVPFWRDFFTTPELWKSMAAFVVLFALLVGGVRLLRHETGQAPGALCEGQNDLCVPGYHCLKPIDGQKRCRKTCDVDADCGEGMECVDGVDEADARRIFDTAVRVCQKQGGEAFELPGIAVPKID